MELFNNFVDNEGLSRRSPQGRPGRRAAPLPPPHPPSPPRGSGRKAAAGASSPCARAAWGAARSGDGGELYELPVCPLEKK